MSAFDDCTLGEIELMTTTCLGGKSMGDESVDPMMMAGGVMWLVQRRTNPNLEWDAFKANTKMGDIKAFSVEMEAADMIDADPTPSPIA